MKPALIVVGLGNPGPSYERTRHNLGFRAVDVLAEVYGEGEWREKQRLLAQTREGRVVTVPVLFVKPQIYMNRSGEAVRKVIDFYKINPMEQLLVVCDDRDLPLGEVRLRRKGSAGTHNGLKSVADVLGEEFSRMRVGLGMQPPGADLAAWVLSVPTEEEGNILRDACAKLPELLKQFVFQTASLR